jgi:hypothetical protein
MIGFLCSIQASLALPKEYFVDPQNGSNSYDGEYPTPQGGNKGPLKTLTYAVNQKANPFDTIHLLTGQYEHDLSDPDKEHYPIYLKDNLIIRAYDPPGSPIHEPVLTNENIWDVDIFKIAVSGGGAWQQNSTIDTSQFIGIKFKSTPDDSG